MGGINSQICGLINNQIEQTNCIQIINFIYKLMNYSIISNIKDQNKRSLSIISNDSNQAILTKIILKNKMKLNKILSRFFEYINIHFNVNYDYIFEATKSVLNFITFSSMNNKQIQD